MSPPIAIDPGHTALLIVDMQNAYCHTEGASRKQGLDIEPCRAIIPRIGELLEISRRKGIPALFTRQEHLPNDAAFARTRFPLEAHERSHIQRRKTGLATPIAGTWDADIVAELTPREGEPVVVKHRWSGFYNTNLEVLLRTLGVDTIVMTGVNSNACIDSTARDAYFRDFTILVVSDGIAAPKENEDLHLATLLPYLYLPMEWSCEY